jgi:hypothetical protein
VKAWFGTKDAKLCIGSILCKSKSILDFPTKKLKIDVAPDFITSIGLTDDGRAIVG